MKMYALYHMSLDELDKMIQKSEDYGMAELVTSNPYEISVQVGARESHDDNWCVEYFTGDDEGNFIDGSDFDRASAHYKRFDPDKLIKEVIHERKKRTISEV